MMRVLAAGTRQEVQTSVGTLNRTHPIDITCASGSALAARFTLDQGFGHVATVFRGLDRHDGWQLQRQEAGGWVSLGQEVEGNDYWQCRFDEMAQSYELTFNVEHDGQATYRLIRIDCDGDGVADAGQLAGDPTLDVDGDSVLDRCEAVGVTYCSPNTPNSTGASGAMTVLGSAVVSHNDLLLTARQVPPNVFGFFITSTTPGSVFPLANSQGTLCVIGDIGRGVGGIVNAGSLGVFEITVDRPLEAGFVSVVPGDTWHFQAWRRTSALVRSAFTDGVAVTFSDGGGVDPAFGRRPAPRTHPSRRRTLPRQSHDRTIGAYATGSAPPDRGQRGGAGPRQRPSPATGEVPEATPRAPGRGRTSPAHAEEEQGEERHVPREGDRRLREDRAGREPPEDEDRDGDHGGEGAPDPHLLLRAALRVLGEHVARQHRAEGQELGVERAHHRGQHRDEPEGPEPGRREVLDEQVEDPVRFAALESGERGAAEEAEEDGREPQRHQRQRVEDAHAPEAGLAPGGDQAHEHVGKQITVRLITRLHDASAAPE